MTDEINDGKIECKVCGKRFKFITSSHLKKHDMTTDEYKVKFPDAKIASEIFSTVQKYKNKEMFEDKIDEETTTEKTMIEDFPLPDDDDQLSKIELSNDKSTYEKNEEDEFLNKVKNYNLDILEEEKVKSESERKFSNIKLSHKREVAKFLNNMFSDIKYDYFIEIKDNQDFLLHNFVTDFTSPKNKTAFFFPDVYWHNEESPSVANKYNVLKEYGWKVIEVQGVDIINNIKNKFKK